MKTKNAYIFSWDMYGIESIVPITQYELIDKENTLRLLKEEPILQNPINSIIQSLILRAQFNPQRHYEIYAINCSQKMDIKFWQESWEFDPQGTADLLRQKGHQIFSNRMESESKIRIK